MSYLTYSVCFQNKVITDKLKGTSVKEMCSDHNISVYTLYKILHMNNKMPIPIQATKSIGFVEGVEHKNVSLNNNHSQERPASAWKYNSDRHIKIKHTCLNCTKEFYARDRGYRTKFCSKKCGSLYKTLNNSTVLLCDNCGDEFIIKNSQAKIYIHCKECRKLKLRLPTSKNARHVGEWLECEFKVEKEKQFDWFYSEDKKKGRFKLDYFLSDYNIGIEYDGEQHFKPSFTSKWESVDKVQYRDRLKDRLCAEHGIKIIRFKYDERIDKKLVLMKIYAELQGNKLVEVEDKKPLR
jgi:very-short-patch-repair endonuclease/DNA-directed RNA polymerase subunit RPC12/RpoP